MFKSNTESTNIITEYIDVAGFGYLKSYNYSQGSWRGGGQPTINWSYVPVDHEYGLIRFHMVGRSIHIFLDKSTLYAPTNINQRESDDLAYSGFAEYEYIRIGSTITISNKKLSESSTNTLGLPIATGTTITMKPGKYLDMIAAVPVPNPPPPIPPAPTVVNYFDSWGVVAVGAAIQVIPFTHGL